MDRQLLGYGTPGFRDTIGLLFLTVLATYYHPEDGFVSGNDTEIFYHPVSIAEAISLADEFNRDEQIILYAVQCQFSSVPRPMYNEYLLQFVYGYMDEEVEDGYLTGIHGSLDVFNKFKPTAAAVLLNDPEASWKEIEAAEDRELNIEDSRKQVDEVLSKFRQVIKSQAAADQEDGAMFFATMKLQYRPPATDLTINYIVSDRCEFAEISLKRNKSMQGPLQRYWLGRSWMDVKLCMQELRAGSSDERTRPRLALYAAIWHLARVMNTRRSQSSADEVLALCERLILIRGQGGKQFEEFLPNILQYHNRVSVTLLPEREKAEESYGRCFAPPTFGEECRYWLPIDGESWKCQELYHALWFLHGQLLLPSQADIPLGDFLDLGAGSGLWADDAATEFHGDRDIIALDLYYIEKPTGWHSVTFEVGNFEAPLVPRRNPVSLIHLRDSYLSLRDCHRLAKEVFDSLSEGGWFQNEETPLDCWNSNKSNFNEWIQRTIDGARALGIQTHTAQNMRTGLEKAGFLEISEKQCSWNTSETEKGARILSFVELTVRNSVKILHEGGSCKDKAANDVINGALGALQAKDCQISVNGYYIMARKPNLTES